MDDRAPFFGLTCGCAACRSSVLQKLAVTLEEITGHAEENEDGLALLLFAAARIARNHGLSEDDFAEMCSDGFDAAKADKPKGFH